MVGSSAGNPGHLDRLWGVSHKRWRRLPGRGMVKELP